MIAAAADADAGIKPHTEAELSDAIAAATGPFRIVGGGTRPPAHLPQGDLLSVAGLSGITLYEPGALTLVARAGTPLAEIEAALAKNNQRLAFEPPDMRALLGTRGAPTIGGVVATNASGPRRVQVGAARDFLLGVRFVDGTGRVVSNGGRVMKNVTGYDLVKLLAGSHGTLGVLSEVSLKVLPDVAAVATLLLQGLSVADAVAAMAAALTSPFEVTGAAHDPQAGLTRIRIEGFDGSVRYRAGELAHDLARFGTAEVVTDRDRVATDWRAIRDMSAWAGIPGDVWRLSLRPSQAPAAVDRLGAEAVRLDRGGALIWALMAPGSDLRGRIGAFDGHATLIRGKDGAGPVFHPEPAPVAALSAGLRARFDPRGILNPGLMG